MLALLWLVGVLVAGAYLVRRFATALTAAESLTIGALAGLTMATLLSFVVSRWFGVGVVSASIALLLVAVPAILLRLRSHQSCLVYPVRSLRASLRRRENRWMLLSWGVTAIILVTVFSRMLFMQNGELFAGFSNVYFDWGPHLPQIAGFARGHDTLDFTALAGQQMGYTFATNFQSALLINLGLSPLVAIQLQSILLALFGLTLLQLFALRLGGRRIATLAPLLFYAAGGLGFITFFSDLWQARDNLASFWQQFPHTYTSQRTEGGVIGNLQWMNPIYAYLVPQRSFLAGLPIVLGVLTLLAAGLRSRRRTEFLIAGSLGALLPLVHSHGLLFLLIVVPVLAGIDSWQHPARWRLWAWCLLPLLLLAIPQVTALNAGGPGQFTPWQLAVLGAGDSVWSLLARGLFVLFDGRFVRLELGWLSSPDPLPWFWLKNWAAWLPLLAVALWRGRRQRSAAWMIAAAASVVWLIGHIVSFQPNDWDNTKLFAYWYAAAIPLVGLLVLRIWQRRRVVAVLLVTSITLAGLLDVSTTLGFRGYPQRFFTEDRLAMGEKIAAATPRDAIILTPQIQANPASAVAGRRVVLGMPFWFDSYGVDVRQRLEDIATMYAADDQLTTQRLLAQYGVDFVLFTPDEGAQHIQVEYQPNENFYRQHYALVAEAGSERLYDLRRPIQR